MNQIFAWILALFLPLSGAQNQESVAPASASLPDWGITVYAEDIRPTGLTLSIHQSGGHPTGQLQFGSDYLLERLENGAWQPVLPTAQGEIGFPGLSGDYERRMPAKNPLGTSLWQPILRHLPNPQELSGFSGHRRF